MRCFFCEDIGLENTTVDLPEREERHLFNTLRGRTGDTVQLIDGKGVIATAKVADGRKLIVIGREEMQEPARKLHLFVSPPRHNRMDQLLTQCCEIGVWSITFIITDHSVVRPEEGAVSEKWKLHLVEGCKQSKNPFKPALRAAIPFSGLFDEIGGMGCKAFYGSVNGSSSDRMPADVDSGIAWIVGPEGGFSDAEEHAMEQAGFTPLRIGRWVMRIETAAIAGAVHLMGDKC